MMRTSQGVQPKYTFLREKSIYGTYYCRYILVPIFTAQGVYTCTVQKILSIILTFFIEFESNAHGLVRIPLELY